MKITKQRLKEIIREELSSIGEGYDPHHPGYDVLPGGGLVRQKQARGMNAAMAKRLFQQIAMDEGDYLSRAERIRAMMWIDKNWSQWETRQEVEEAIKQWLAAGGE